MLKGIENIQISQYNRIQELRNDEALRKVAGQHLDTTEFLTVETHTADEIEDLIHTGNFQQSVHVMAWLLAKERD